MPFVCFAAQFGNTAQGTAIGLDTDDIIRVERWRDDLTLLVIRDRQGGQENHRVLEPIHDVIAKINQAKSAYDILVAKAAMGEKEDL